MDHKTLRTVIDNSIAIYDGMVAHWPQYDEDGKDESMFVSDMVSKFNDCYATNNSTTAFIHAGQLYVTPCYVWETLHKLGFYEEVFFVPFSNGDYPRDAKERWEELRLMAKKMRKEKYQAECTKWCLEHNIGEISHLERFFRIPDEGVVVRYPQGHTGFHGAMCPDGLNSFGSRFLGKFCRNNGIVIFVHIDGNTYLAKGYDIIKELVEENYDESSFMVPMSNNEVIVDEQLAAEWKKIQKNPKHDRCSYSYV